MISPTPAFSLSVGGRWLAGSAYRRPSDPSALFVWQIAVHPEVRNTGLGKGLIVSALNRRYCDGVTHINATVTLSNPISGLFFCRRGSGPRSTNPASCRHSHRPA